MPRIDRSVVSSSALSALLTLLISISASAQDPAQTFASTVSSISVAETQTFIDVTRVGHDAALFVGRWIRIVTAASPEGLVARITAFDSAIGEFTIDTPIPAASVSLNDVYLVGSTTSVPPAIAPTAATELADAVVNTSAIDVQDTSIFSPVITPPAPIPGTPLIWGNVVKTDTAAVGIDGLGGDDTIISTGPVTAITSNTILPSVVPLAVVGVESADVSSKAIARTAAIAGGQGGDAITSTGAIAADASASAAGVSVAIAPVREDAGDATMVGNVKAIAEAQGISGVTCVTISPLSCVLLPPTDGNDTVVNRAVIDVTATANSLAVGASAVENAGEAATSTKATATSDAAAINLGGGDDTLDNQARVTATADASADALNVTVAVRPAAPDPPDSPIRPVSATATPSELKSAVSGGPTATAFATGLGADSAGRALELEPVVTFGPQSATLGYEVSFARARGDDTVTNDAEVVATATATTRTLGVGISSDGNTGAEAEAKSNAGAAAIDLGDGNDSLTNTGALTAAATATATAANVTVSAKTTRPATDDGATRPQVSVKSAIEGGATAEALATGISADTARADNAVRVAITAGNEVSVAVEYREERPGGDDAVTNSGAVDAAAAATSNAGSLGVTVDGKTAAKISSEATATAAAIDLGAGNDTLTNNATGQLTATSDATANALGLALGISTDPAVAKDVEAAVKGDAKAESVAVGISADAAVSDTVYTGTLTIGNGAALTIEKSELSAGGNDAVTNHATVDATASATSRAGALAVTIDGDANAKLESEAKATGGGIDLGSGDDTVTNTGALAVTADATAQSLNIAVGIGSSSGSGSAPTSRAKSSADGSAEAEARAVGLSADGLSPDTTQSLTLGFATGPVGAFVDYLKEEVQGTGDDRVTNSGAIDARATASTTSAAVGMAVNGAASAESSSKAEATATAIDLGSGADTLTNDGLLTANATATANGLAVSATNQGSATSTGGAPAASEGLWKGGVESAATATGIDAAGANDTVKEAHVLLNGTVGLDVQYIERDAAAPDGADTIVNRGAIEAIANAASNAANVSMTADGTAAAVTHVESTADATGIRGGDAGDDISNLGTAQMIVDAAAAANAGTVAVSGKGVAAAADTVWSGGTTAEATAIGIDGDGGTTKSKALTVQIDGNGVEVVHEKAEVQTTGDDTIVNEQAVTVSASADAPSLAVALQAGRGVAAAISTVETTADATGIRGGSGNDDITNQGALTVQADATTRAAAIAFSNTGLAVAGSALWDGGVQAVATAVGIDADGGSDTVKTTTLTIDGNGASIVHEKEVTAATGDDIVTNDAAIAATATSTSDAVGVAITTRGVAVAASQSTAAADATAIRGGGGDDIITNTGTLTATADASARALNVAVNTGNGVSAAGNAVWDGGVTADATAVGIRGDGGDANTQSTLTISSSGDSLIDRQSSSVQARGDDVITNVGQITAAADATTPQASVSIAVNGVATAISTATANASATAIDANDGNDTVTNSGHLIADAAALAAVVSGSGVNQGVAVSANDLWDGGVNADARTRGIDGGAGFDTLTNHAQIDASSSATTLAATVAVAVTGVPVAVSTSTATSNATAIDAGGGVEADVIDNLAGGTLTVDASAFATTANVSVTNAGLAVAADSVWNGGTKADAAARGIDAGNGADTITNAGIIAADASATTAAAAVSVAVSGAALASATSSAASTAIAIDAGDGHDIDTVTNHGTLSADATSIAVAATVSVTNAGVAVSADSVWDGGTSADAIARGISTGAGGDTITNDGAIDAASSSTAGAAAVAVAVSGVAGAIATSTARAAATSIDATDAGHADTVTNTGALTADADALALATAVSFTNAGLAVAADAVWDGGTTADAAARGIATGGGRDTIDNSGAIIATADANTGSASVSVAVSGVAGAIATSNAAALATAIDAGDDNDADTVINSGLLTADATARAATVTVGVTTAGVSVAGDSAWDGGTQAGATARTINTGAGADDVTNSGDVNATADAATISVPVSVAISGVAAAVGTSTAEATSAAVDTGDGDDTIDNDTTGQPGQTGMLTADATATAAAATVSITTGGLAVATDAVWDGGTTGTANAAGIASGWGSDHITNRSTIDASSTANALSGAVSVAVVGVAAASATSTAQSAATAIDASGAGSGTHPDSDLVTNFGALSADATARALSTSVSVTTGGLAVAADAVWDGGTSANAAAGGINTGAGNDAIVNGGTIDTTADATTGSVAVGVAVAGVAAATATSTAQAAATAINTGDGADQIANTGRLSADANALAGTVTVSVTTAGVAVSSDAVWNGGTTAETAVHTISAGSGHDVVTNIGDVAATSDATAASAAVTVAVAGVGAAVGTSTAIARSTAIDTGDGNDEVTNLDNAQTDRTGHLTADATANAAALTVTVTPFGVAVASDSVWDGGTTAAAAANGIDAGLGTDTVDNTSAIESTATANTGAATVSVNVFGVAAALSNSTANATAAAIKTGAETDLQPRVGSPIETPPGPDADTVLNAGNLSATADSLAVAAGVGFTFGGVAGATDASWDGGTTSGATARGVHVGAGNDTVVNSGEIGATSDANTDAVTASIAVFGVAGAVSTGTAAAHSSAIDGGAGNDIITNLQAGALTANAEATSVAVNVGLTLIGAAVASDAAWNGGSTADATAVGIDGGAGQDTVTNHAQIDTLADSTTASVAVTVAGIGAGAASSTSTSTADAKAIDGGDANDTLVNSGNLTATSLATATGVAVTATGIGAGVATDAVWNGGTAANANATGIAGGGGNDTVSNTATTITADAASDTHSVSVAFTAGGLAAAVVGSTSTARATAIDGNAGADTLTSERTLVSSAAATAEGVSVAAAVGGVTVTGALDNSTRADATATGVAGGDDADTITTTTQSSILSTSTATTLDTAVSVVATGFAIADAQARAIGQTFGIDGGTGDDVLENNGAITGTSTAETTARSVSVSLGSAGGNTAGTAEVFGTGVAGGADNDTITNRGQVDLTGTATARGQSVNVSVAGGAVADASGTGRATLVGLDGGTGDDTITNVGDITLTPTASGFGQNVAVNVAGASVNNASTFAEAFATGLDGGDGADTVTNNRSIEATVTTTATARSTGVVVAGATVNQSNSSAESHVTGAGGGDGVDHVTNTTTGTIEVAANATTIANGVTVSVFGANSAAAQTTPTAGAVGLDGGAGDDFVINDGLIDATASAASQASNSSVNVTGGAGARAGTTAAATATGLDGNLGNDLVLNRSAITLGGTSTASVTGSSWTLAGGASDSSVLSAAGTAAGLFGGAGVDHVRNEGSIDIALTSSLNATGGSDAIFGGAGSSTQLAALTSAVGASGGDGADLVENLLSIQVTSTANVTASRAAVSFAGHPDSSALLSARAESIGLDGGLDVDRMFNSGALLVDAFASSNVSDGASAQAFGSPASSGVGSGSAHASGVTGGGGGDTLTNAGTVIVRSFGEALTTNSSSSGLFFSSSDTLADATGGATAYGLSGGAGDDALTNSGVLDVTADAAGYSLAYASGAHVSFEGDGHSVANASARGVARGILGGDDANTVINNGEINVAAVSSTVRTVTPTTRTCTQTTDEIQTVTREETQPDGTVITITEEVPVVEVTCEEPQTVTLSANPTNALANGNGLSGDGYAASTGVAEADAAGVQVGAGANTIVNAGDVSVTASPEARAHAFADGDAFGDANGYATARAEARATGVLAGNGANDILNSGSLTVVAAPTAQAQAQVSDGDICIFYLFGTWCGGGGSGYGNADATFDAEAIGIATGGGANLIVNEGLIDVTSAPVVNSFAARVLGADAETLVETTVVSRAVGIQTGDGDNEVRNATSGVIDVTAADVACSGAHCSRSRDAIGILTGAGADLIVNDGSIVASLAPAGGAVTAGVAIDAGGGNDRVVLGSASQTTGMVLLGTGTDRLVWSSGAQLTGTANGGAEAADVFALGGRVDGDFHVAEIGSRFNAFERFHKEGDATWTLLGNRAIDWTVEQGTLQVAGNLTGTFDTAVGGIDAQLSVLAGATVGRTDGNAVVRLNGDGMLVNQGLVEATSAAGVGVESLGAGSLIVNEAQIVSGGVGVAMNGVGGLLANTGAVQGTGASGVGVQIAGTDNLALNDGSIAGSAAGVVLAGADNTFTNRSTVSSSGAAAVQFGSAAGVSNRVVNEAGARFEGVGGLAILGGAGNDFVTNHGTIAGAAGEAMDLAGGSDQLLITATSTIDGISRGGAGIDTLTLGGAANASFNQRNIGTFFEGFELFRKNGSSRWALTGTGSHDWLVEEGGLAIAGTVLGSIATLPGGPNTAVSIEATGLLRRADGLPALVLAGRTMFENSGRIESTGAGIVAAGGPHTIVNLGTIQAGGLALQLAGNGNLLRNGGTLHGGTALTVTGAGNTLINNASIVGTHRSGFGLQVAGDRNAIANGGSIEGATALTIAGAGNTLINSSLINGSYLGVGISGSDTTIVNDVFGVIQSSNGFAIRGGAGVETIENHGTIFSGAGAAIDLEGGDDLLRLFTTARLGGSVGGGAGFDTLALEGLGSVRLDLDTFNGFEHLRKLGGGSWLLSGSSDMSWELTAGRLVIDGTLSGAGRLEAGGTLAGNGGVGGFINAGLVAPGMSIGAIRVLGDYEHAPSGVLQIEGSIFTDLSDRLHVDGRAVLNGGTLSVLPELRDYGVATEYTVIDAAGGVSGSFGTIVSGQTHLDPFVDYGATSVSVMLIRNDVSFARMGETANARSVGAALDASKRSMARGDFKGVADEFLVIDEGQQHASLQTLGGELHAATARTALRTGERFFAASVDRQVSASASGSTRLFWTDAVRFVGNIAGDGNASRTTYGATGFLSGLDLMVNGATRVGAAFGFSAGSTELGALAGDGADTRTLAPSVYGEHDNGVWSLAGGIGYAAHRVRTGRGIQVGSLARQASAAYGADQVSGMVRVGMNVPGTPAALSLRPFGELRYATLSRDGFDESGAGSAALAAVERLRASSLRSLVGVRARLTPSVFGMRVEPEVQAAWAHESRDTHAELSAALSGTAGLAAFQRFHVLSAVEARDSLVFSVGARTAVVGHGSAFVAYDGSAAETGSEHGFSAGVRFAW